MGSENDAPAAADAPRDGSENKPEPPGVADRAVLTAPRTPRPAQASTPAAPPATPSPPAGAREPGSAELDDRRWQLQDLAWGWTRRLGGLGPDDAPFSLHETGTGQEWWVAQLAVLRRVRGIVDSLIDSTARMALQLGASHADVAAAADISVQTARKRWPPAASRPAPADR